MLNRKSFAFAVIASFINVYAIAQSESASAVNDKAGLMRSDGKIYVVVAVLLTILAGLIIYVARLDRKISKLEKGN